MMIGEACVDTVELDHCLEPDCVQACKNRHGPSAEGLCFSIDTCQCHYHC